MAAPSRSPSYYVDLGSAALTDMLNRELALVWGEVEAKAAERKWATLPHSIDPHHLTAARRLLQNELFVEITEPTRGGRPVTVLIPRQIGRRRRGVEAAAARKRLLQARFYGWAQGTASEPARIGPAGEAVVHASFRDAAPVAGYRLFNPTTGQVPSVGGQAVLGAFDNGGLLTLYDDYERPTGSIAVVVEVKNLRDWLYPNSHELYQLLSKAARLTAALGEGLPVLPVLVCRRAHFSLRKMASALGFLVYATALQYITPLPSDINPRYLTELQNELEYNLIEKNDADQRLVAWLTTTIPRNAETFSQRWLHAGPALQDHFDALRRDTPQPSRTGQMDGLREAAANLELEGGW